MLMLSSLSSLYKRYKRRGFPFVTGALALCALLPACSILTQTTPPSQPNPPVGLQQAYIDQGQGMFIHFNLESFLRNGSSYVMANGQWALKNAPRSVFNPSGLDTDEWADAAVEAGLRFGVLTAKHHNGFALWDTDLSTHDVANTAWCTAERNAGRSCDVMKRYADSFRRRGLAVGVYFSIWDRVAEIEEGVGTGTKTILGGRTATAYVKAQITELLGTATNRPYGEIQSIWFDAWDWNSNSQGYGAPKYSEIPYAEVRDHIRSISPNTLIINNDKYSSLTSSDILTIEQEINLDNPLPAAYVERSWTIASDNSWFWNPGSTESNTPRQVADAADDINMLRAKGGLTLFNFGPDTRGGISAGYRAFGKLLGYATRKDNLAQGKTATQSSTYSDRDSGAYGPGEAVDGLFKASEGIAHTTASDNPWWKVDLGRDEPIETVVLFNTNDTRFQQRLSNLKVEILNAAGEVVSASATLNPNNGLSSPQGLIVHFGNGVSGRSVRITRDTTGKTNDTDKYLALGEVMVFSPTSVAITTSKSVHNGSAFTAPFTFSEPVWGFRENDIASGPGYPRAYTE